MDFFIKNQPQTDSFEALWNLFKVFHQLAPWVKLFDKGHCSKTLNSLYFCGVEDLWIAISNDFLQYRVVIPKAFWIWLNAPFF